MTSENKEISVGVWNTIPDLETINMLAGQLDFVYVDLEHGFRDTHLISNAILLLNALGKNYSIRVRSCNDPIIQTLVDFGVRDIIVPQLRGKEEFLDFKRKINWPPLGTRGVHPRINFSSNSSEYSMTTITVIIETKESIDLIEYFASDPQVKSLYLGVFDLAQELEISGGPDSKSLDLYFNKISDVCQSRGKFFAAMLPKDVSLKEFRLRGVNKILLGIDLVLLQNTIASVRRIES